MGTPLAAVRRTGADDQITATAPSGLVVRAKNRRGAVRPVVATGARVVLAVRELGELHEVSGMRCVDEVAAADVHAHVVDRRAEEHDVAGLQVEAGAIFSPSCELRPE